MLIVDADSGAASAVADVLSREGLRVELAMDLRGALDAYDLVVVAVPDGKEPAELVDLIRPAGLPGGPEVVLLSGRHDVDAAVGALHRGASDYLLRPVAPARLRLAIARALERRRLLRENARLRGDLALFAAAQRLLELLEPAALARAGVEALCVTGGAAACAVWSRYGVRAAHGLTDDEASVAYTALAPIGFVEHHTGGAVGLPRFAVVMLLDIGRDLVCAIAFDAPPAATAQEGVLFLARQLSTAFDNAARYQDAAELALRDPLTGLWNASAFQTALEGLLSSSQAPFCVLFLDLDHFKQVNDRFGHTVGSRAIVEVARVLEAQVREGDVVARYGGDELVVLLPAASAEAGLVVGDRIRRAVREMRIPGADDVRVTVSVGVACALEDGASAEALLDAADRGLYLAKSARDAVRRANSERSHDVSAANVVPLSKLGPLKH